MRPEYVFLAALLAAFAVGLGLAARWFLNNRTNVAFIERSWGRVLAWPPINRFARRNPRFWRFIAARFAPGEYLGLHLTIGFLISIAGLWGFGAITDAVVNNERITRFDNTVLEWLHAHGTARGQDLFVWVSLAGSTQVQVALAALFCALLARRRLWLFGAGLVASMVGGNLIDAALKLAIRRERPSYATILMAHPGWSFPSGHAMGALVGYGMMAYLIVTLWATRRRTRVAVVIGAAIMVIAIGFSRLYLGLHYFSDVVGGYAAGVLWLSACMSGLEIARRRPVAPPPSPQAPAAPLEIPRSHAR
jgi:membrane-associated phospholipid phosphatase